MSSTQWKPNTTVAAIIERDGRFLMVREQTDDGARLNQPAGHLEYGETLLQAVVREAREETAHAFTPRALVGIYLADKTGSDITYLRFAFCGDAGAHDPTQRLDDGILAAEWLSADEIMASADLWRSPLVGRCLQDYLAGQRASLDLIHHHLPG